MGSSPCPLLWEIYMYYFREKLFNVHAFSYWFKYVDDTFVIDPPMLTFLICCLRLIWLIAVFNSLLNLKTIVLFLFLMYWYVSTLTDSQGLSSENPSQSFSLLMFFLIILLNRKWLLSMLTFIVFYTFYLFLLILPMNITT